jgi:putative methylase
MRIGKKELISIIQKTQPFITPKIHLEQYCIDAQSAVDIVYFAGFEFNDIKNKLIFDLGAGTGRLSIASALLNAHMVIGIDLDWEALMIFRKNINTLDLDDLIFPICCDVYNFEIEKSMLSKNLKITTIMNPPFGVQKRMADRIFLEKAFSFSDVVYSIHLTSNQLDKFISNYIKKFNWIIDYKLPFQIILEKSFQFHKLKRKKIDVTIYRFKKKFN